jgi:Reverse transcriptase (RNA-dependent DNA polymerase)
MTQRQKLTNAYVKELQSELAFIEGFPGEFEQDEIDDLIQALDAVGAKPYVHIWSKTKKTRRQRKAHTTKPFPHSHTREKVTAASSKPKNMSAANVNEKINPKNNGNSIISGKIVRANADSGATGHYLTVEDISVLRDVCLSSPTQQISVAVANGTLLQSTHHGFLDVPGHSPMIAYIIPQLKGSLLSISQLVNVGLQVLYCADFVTGFDSDNNAVFQGDRDVRTGLWMVDLRTFSRAAAGVTSPVSAHSAASAVRLDSVADFVNFWHAAYGSPAVSTFLAAIDKAFIRVPGLTSAKVRRHPPDSLATAYGHLHATRKGLRSTKKSPLPVAPPSSAKSDDNMEPGAQPRERRIWFQVHDVRAGRAHSDATGALPQRGRSGALFQIVFYHEDSNVIHIELSRSRSGPDLLAALQRAVKFFTDRGAPPLLVRMDNECAEVTKTWLASTSIRLELTPVAQHRTNKAERAISTWKDHFIATLATTDPDCPLSLWEDFVEQAELTLNCMRVSSVHPSLSAWEALCGPFDILATPIAPLGMKVLVHDTPEKRGSWQVHGKLGYYIGRALLHYRCHTVYMVESRATRVSDCLAWFPAGIKMPGTSLIEELTASVDGVRRSLAKLLSSNADPTSRQPLQEAEDILAEQLRAVRQLFQHITPTEPEQRVPELPSASTWPRGQQLQPVQPVQQHQLVLQRAHTGIAPALPSDITAPLQRVLAAPRQRVPTASRQRAVTLPAATLPAVTLTAVPSLINNNLPTVQAGPIVIPFRPNQPAHLPPKPRNMHQYFTLSPAEIHKISKPKFKCVGMQFVDDADPQDTSSGVVTSIVRHKKSNKLAYKFWDHHIFDSEPTDQSAFDYINVNYAVTNCKWSKYRSVVAHGANLVAAEDTYRNRLPSAKQRKRSKQRNRYIPWWHKLVLRANTAIMTTPQDYDDFHACTALDLNADGTRLTSASALKGPDKLLWEKAHGEEIVRLIESQTGRFIHRREMLADRTAAYYNPQLKIKVKAEGTQYRVRGTIGGDKVHYPGVTTAYTAHLETIRVMLNAIVSEDAEFCTADIKDFYLGTPLDRKEYMRIPLKHIPLDIQERYNIESMEHNGWVLMEISKGIYGLPQAGKLAQDRLVAHLATHEYIQCVNTPCLFVHRTNGVAFTLVVDDFLIKFKQRSAAEHLLSALRELYTITTDFSARQKYVGITLDHNKKKRYIDMSIPGYVEKAIQRFQRTNLKGADSPIIYVPPNYGKHQQEAPMVEPAVPLTAAETHELQEIVGVFLFYSRAVDPTMLTAINKIASRQAKPTSLIKQEVERFLQYANKWPNATMRVRASNMKLVCHSDGSYLSESEARSRAGGMLFLGDCEDNDAPNAPVCFLSVIIKTVVTSATAAEYAAAFIVGQAAISIINTLGDLGYPQSETEIFCDNLCAVGIANNSFNLKRTKTIDMRFHWLRDQVKLRVFKVIWKAGKLNLADFFTKAHPVKHHLEIRWKYVLMARTNIPSSEGVLLQDKSPSPISIIKI